MTPHLEENSERHTVFRGRKREILQAPPVVSFAAALDGAPIPHRTNLPAGFLPFPKPQCPEEKKKNP